MEEERLNNAGRQHQGARVLGGERREGRGQRRTRKRGHEEGVTRRGNVNGGGFDAVMPLWGGAKTTKDRTVGHKRPVKGLAYGRK